MGGNVRGVYNYSIFHKSKTGCNLDFVFVNEPVFAVYQTSRLRTYLTRFVIIFHKCRLNHRIHENEVL